MKGMEGGRSRTRAIEARESPECPLFLVHFMIYINSPYV